MPTLPNVNNDNDNNVDRAEVEAHRDAGKGHVCLAVTSTTVETCVHAYTHKYIHADVL
jgi:hypothetical protein